MQADTLRLILIALGALLIVGIYLWDRRKTGKPGLFRRRVTNPAKQEPSLGSLAEGGEPPESGLAPRAGADEDDLSDLPPLHLDQPDLKPPAKAKTRKGPFRWGKRSRDPQADLFQPASDEEALAHYRKANSGLPILILRINIATRTGRFAGSDVLQAATAAGLEAGAMDIFHRYDKPGAARHVLFSMASMVEPGTFPFAKMSGFSTPGLSLFAQLPGPQDGQVVYEAMLSAARQMAERLGGELLDETNSVLSRQTIEHVRTEIAEHRRQVALAKKQA